jgi:uncharacterized membrane protein
VNSIPFVPVLVLGSLVGKFVDFLKYLSKRDWNGVVTQLIAWAAGVGGVLLMAQTQFADGVDIGGTKLSALNTPSQILLGLMATSLLSVVYDVKKAVDSQDSAKMPKLIGN